jgi:hypothetical protein
MLNKKGFSETNSLINMLMKVVQRHVNLKVVKANTKANNKKKYVPPGLPGGYHYQQLN